LQGDLKKIDDWSKTASLDEEVWPEILKPTLGNYHFERTD